MSASLIAALLLLTAVNFRALFPSRDHHWRFAYGVIAIGVPILIWATYENGPWVGLLLFLAGASVLRWPLIYLWRWIKGRVT